MLDTGKVNPMLDTNSRPTLVFEGSSVLAEVVLSPCIYKQKGVQWLVGPIMFPGDELEVAR